MGDAALTAWLGQPVDRWRSAWGLPLLQVHGRVGSTNDLARQLARDGAPHGATVLADFQDQGRGRRSRPWLAPPGSSLLLSMVLHPATPETGVLLPLRLGIAASRALETVVPLRVGLKWPNDLFVGSRKVGGILCETGREPGRPDFVVAGIGINISQADEDWLPELRGVAASLEQLSGRSVDRATVAGRIVGEWLAVATRDAARLTPDELHEFHRRDLLHGHSITIDGRPAGTAQGIDPDGALRAGEPGSPHRVMAGTVRRRDLVSSDPTSPDTRDP
jgi:BirA family transcriptional regulator, biotin operon repressor / biotin---[acetyl-CoA-carboxylase] ligase